MAPPPTPEPWDDGRLDAAFEARASRAHISIDLERATRASLRGERTSVPTPTWRRLLAPATVLVLAIATVAGGAVLIRGSLGSAGFVQFRDGPTPDLRTLDAGTFTFDFPADWLAYDAAAPFSGGSSTAVIGTQAVEARCGDAHHVDINCVYEQPLDPGDIRVFVGSGAYRGGTVLDRADIENGTTARLTVGGMPAIRNDYDVQPDTYYREDVSMALEIALPTSLSNVIRIEVRAREWPFRGRVNTAAEVRAAVQTMVDSFRFTPPPVPLPADPSAAVTAARAAIQTQADGFRQGYVDPGSSALTYLDCPGDEPGTATRASVRYGPGGDLGRPVDLVCSWTVTPETPSIWRLDLTYEWSADGRSGRYVETLWLDATATAVASTFAGDPPPVAASEPSGPTEVAGLKVIPVVDAIEIRDAGVDDRELAVGGWFSPMASIGCPAPAEWPTSPVQPVCPDQWTVLMQEPEVLVTVEPNGATGRAPGGPAIEIDLDDIDRTWEPSLPELGPGSPVQIVVVGHFDDRRSAACPQDLEQACRDRFVVDRVDWVEGVEPQPSVVDSFDGEQASAVDDIRAIVETEAPDSPILSVAVVDGPTGIGRIEPFLGTGRGGFIDQRVIWVIRVLEGDRAVTYLVVDGTDAIFEMTADGEPVPVGGTLPTPSAASAASNPLVDGRIAVAGVDGVPGELLCAGRRFPVEGLAAPSGAEGRSGPEFDALRATIADPGFADGFADITAVTWREAGRTADSVLFLAEKPINADERHWVGLAVVRGDEGWKFDAGGDCQPRAILPDGVGPATWVLDPAFPAPTGADRSVHLLVTEVACASAQPADDRLAPAYVVADPYRIEITIGVKGRPGGQDCPGNPPTAVEVALGAAIGDRALVDPNAPPVAPSGG